MLTIRHNRQIPLAEAPQKKRDVLRSRQDIVKPTFPEPSFVSEAMSNIIKRVTDKHYISAGKLFSRMRFKPIAKARRELICLIHHEMGWSSQQIAAFLRMDNSTVQYHLGLKKKSGVKYGALNDD